MTARGSRALVVAALLVLDGCATLRPATEPAPETIPQERPGPSYPSAAVGAIDAAVTRDNIQQTVCVPGYTKTVRPPTSYTNRVKLQQLQGAGLDPVTASDYELDHLIALAIGGHPSERENLWLQPWEGEYGARRKDRCRHDSERC